MNSNMRLFTRNGIYWVEISRNKRISLRTRNKEQAKTAFNRLKRDRFHQHVAVLEGRSTVRLEDFTRDFLEHSQAHKSKDTYRADRLALGKLLDYFGPGKILGQITSREVERFIGKLKSTGLKETSLAVYYRHLKAAFSKAKKWKIIRENPFMDVSAPRPQKAAPRYLLSEEIQRLLSAEPDPAFQRLWRFYLWSGVRRREALALTWANVNRQAGIISVPQTKNRKAKVVRITPEIAKVLDELSGEIGKLFPWTPDAVSHHFARTAKKAKIKARLHDLRHTFASHLLMSGVDLYDVQKLLGHEDSKATQIYAHLNQDHLDKALLKLDFADKTRTED